MSVRSVSRLVGAMAVCVACAASGRLTGFGAATAIGQPGPARPLMVTYPPGWHIISGRVAFGLDCPDLCASLGPFYTLQAGDIAYESLPDRANVRTDGGYWFYAPTPVSATVTTSPDLPDSISVPAGQWILVGNPFSSPASISPGGGSMIVIGFDSRGYQDVSQLQVGQGAFVYASQEATLTLSPIPSS
jgi:hypothetical protein